MKEPETLTGLRQQSADVQSNETSVVELIQQSLKKAKMSTSVFISINENIIEQAQLIDNKIASGNSISTLSGLPISLKDLFDEKDHVTLAGSKVLKTWNRLAEKDCAVVEILRESGLLFIGRTNMSEFAFSGMGLNPHYGTPLSIWDRETARLPGGSSSGSAVSVAEGIVTATMGSDTAGSCRIPAAFNGIVGVKPSYGRYSLENIYPLSPTSDAPGPMAVDVDSCFILDQVITGSYGGYGDLPELELLDPTSLRLLVPDAIVMQELDKVVQCEFDKTLSWFENAGIEIVTQPMTVLDQCVDMFVNRSIAGFEAWQHHQPMLEKYADQYDPFVAKRIQKFESISTEIQQQRYEEKDAISHAFNQFMMDGKYDAVIYPTVPCVPPSIRQTQDPKNTARTNLRCLRNSSTANYFNGCSISLPCHNTGDAPVGLMMSLENGKDRRLYQLAATVEAVLNQNRIIT